MFSYPNSFFYRYQIKRGDPGIEPGTSCTQNKNHTTRPIALTNILPQPHFFLHLTNLIFFILIIIILCHFTLSLAHYQSSSNLSNLKFPNPSTPSLNCSLHWRNEWISYPHSFIPLVLILLRFFGSSIGTARAWLFYGFHILV